MKNRSFKIFAMIIMAIMVIALSSCSILTAYVGGYSTDSSLGTNSSIDLGTSKDTSQAEDTGSIDTNTDGLLIKSVDINSAGELIITYTDGSKQNLGKVTSSSGDVNVNIEGSGNNASYATALGLRSAVSIQCSFTITNRFGATSTSASAGSGFIYKLDKEEGDAFIVTNFHVVYSDESTNANGIADSIYVYLYGSEYSDMKIPATYIGGSNNYDVAVLRVEDCDLLKSGVFREATIANSDETYVGQSAIAIGNPDSAGLSASYGVISVYSEQITLNIGGSVSLRVMRIDTPVNSGNSGGGLYNEKGELIGIVNAKTSDESLENIGYAIPSNIVKGIADNIIDNCYGTDLERVQRVLLGITVGIADSKAYLTDDGHIKVKETVYVTEVTKTGIAYGYLKADDILISAKINDTEIEIVRQHQIIDFLLTARVGDTFYITVERGGENVTLEIAITKNAITEY